MTRARWVRFLLVMICSMAVSDMNAALADDLRTWTDKSGKYKVQAKFKAVENGKVVLEDERGQRMEIALDKLSAADQKMAEDLQKGQDNPFKKTAENPFEKKEAAKGSVPTGERARSMASRRRDTASPSPTISPGAESIALSEIDWSGVKQLLVAGVDWKTPAPGRSLTSLNWQPRPLGLPPKADFFENITGLATSAGAKKAVVISALEKPGAKDHIQGRLFVCDLEKGRMTRELRFEGKFAPLALSADGTQLVVRQEVFGFDNSDQVELWRITETGLERVKRWRPVEKATARGRDVTWAAFLEDGKKLLTHTSGGNLTWWSLPEVHPVMQLQIQGNVTPALSADGEILACCLNNELVLLDSKTGEAMAAKPTERNFHEAKLAFSPDRQKLACFQMNKLDVWNLATGSVEASMNVNGHGQQAALFWTGPEAIMAGNPATFVDLSMQYPIWSYDGTDKLAPLGDWGIFVVHDPQRNGFTLIPSRLPHQAAVKTVEQAKKDPNFFLLKPDVPVRVDVSGIQLLELQPDAAALLKQKLQANGNPVSTNAAVTLKASLVKGKDHEISYRSFGTPPFREGRKYTVPGWEYKLEIVAGNKTHWQTGGGTFPPPIIHLREDETVESHLKKYGTPKADFFKNIELPKYVAVSQGNQTGTSTSLRRSTVTPLGVR